MESEESIFSFSFLHFFFSATFLDCSTSPFLSIRALISNQSLSLDSPFLRQNQKKQFPPPPRLPFFARFCSAEQASPKSRNLVLHKMTQRGEDKGSGSGIGLSSFFLGQLPSSRGRSGNGNGACIECTTRSHFDIKTRKREREKESLRTKPINTIKKIESGNFAERAQMEFS